MWRAFFPSEEGRSSSDGVGGVAARRAGRTAGSREEEARRRSLRRSVAFGWGTFMGVFAKERGSVAGGPSREIDGCAGWNLEGVEYGWQTAR